MTTMLDRLFALFEPDSQPPTYNAFRITRDGETWTLIGTHPPITREEAITRFACTDARPA